MSTVYKIDPLADPRWEKFLQRHPRACVFHSSGWLEALHRTYGYKPIVLTTTPSGAELENGLIFCLVDSWLTGRRLVSLPFSDHCDPLVSTSGELKVLVEAAKNLMRQANLKSVELRPLDGDSCFPNTGAGLEKGECFYFHRVDLRPNLAEIFQRFHKNCVQRSIRRAEREKLRYEEGRSDLTFQSFYHLLMLTRRRHQLPPQPLEWFRNLLECMGDKGTIRVCYKNDQPIASILTLMHKDSMVYKYGCSDAEFHRFGGMPYLIWKAIQDAKQNGAVELDLGRCDFGNESLATFKEHFGGSRSLITYWKYPAVASCRFIRGWKVQLPKRFLQWMPDRLFGTAGKLLYKHIG